VLVVAGVGTYPVDRAGQMEWGMRKALAVLVVIGSSAVAAACAPPVPTSTTTSTSTSSTTTSTIPGTLYALACQNERFEIINYWNEYYWQISGHHHWSGTISELLGHPTVYYVDRSSGAGLMRTAATTTAVPEVDCPDIAAADLAW
jgi:hypothetical protein